MEHTLLFGYTDWIDQTFLSRAFPDDLCVCVGQGDRLKAAKKLRLVEKEDMRDRRELQTLLGTWEFRNVVFFSESLGLMKDTPFDELRVLSELLDLLAGERGVRVLVLAGVNRQHTGALMEEQLISASLEKLSETCRRWNRDVVFLHCPWVYDVTPERFDPQLEETIRNAGKNGGKLEFPLPADQEIRMISRDDLAQLLNRFFDRWVEEDEPHDFTAGLSMTCRDLGDALEKALPELSCSYDDSRSVIALPAPDTFLREKYGWFQHYDFVTDLTGGEQETKSRQRTGKDEEEEKDRKLRWRKVWQFAKKTLELLLGFAIMELLNRFSGTQVKFQLIDFRLLYVLIIGLMYNIPMGLAAGALASLSMIWGYRQEGVGFLTLFYEPTNWFAFIIYFIVGAVCGYIRTKDRDDLAFASQESQLLREKYRFLRELFLEAQQERQEYRQQIISSQDSFGKIFRITRQLDVISPHLVFVQAMSVIEEIMDNQTVSIYSIGRNRHFARLEAASRGLGVPRSLDLDSYEEVLQDVLELGIWTNTALDGTKPMYVAGVERDDQPVLLIMIWKARFGQMSLYYSNLLKILCGLISTSLLRSLDFQNVTREQRYVADTQLLTPRAFREELEITWSMNLKKIANYTLHRMKGEQMDAMQISALMSGRIRENDMMGLVGEKVYLLVSQSTEEGLEIMQSRFSRLGITLRQADFEEVMKRADELLEGETV